MSKKKKEKLERLFNLFDKMNLYQIWHNSLVNVEKYIVRIGN